MSTILFFLLQELFKLLFLCFKIFFFAVLYKLLYSFQRGLLFRFFLFLPRRSSSFQWDSVFSFKKLSYISPFCNCSKVSLFDGNRLILHQKLLNCRMSWFCCLRSQFGHPFLWNIPGWKRSRIYLFKRCL